MEMKHIAYIQIYYLICFLFVIVHVNGELFTSIRHIAFLLKNEDNLFKGLEAYYEAEEKKLKLLRETIDDLEINYLNGTNFDANTDIEIPKFKNMDIMDPIDNFKVLHRYNSIWLKNLHNAGNKENINLVTKYLTIKELPKRQDFQGACLSVLRIQRTYKLSTSDLSNGKVIGVVTRPLSKSDCDDIAIVAQNNALFKDYAVEWRQAALEKVDKNDKASISVAYLNLANAYQSVNNYTGVIKNLEMALDNDPENETLYENVLKVYEKMSTMNLEEQKVWNRNVTDAFQNYEALCRGDIPPKKLYCKYRKGDWPYERIKEEILSTDPWISLLYDVISSSEADKMVELAYPEMKRAQMVGGQTGDNRISKVGWLDDSLNYEVAKIGKRISRLIHLQTTAISGLMTSEPFQVVTYGIGGQYEPHKDYFDDNISKNQFGKSRNRVATFIFYLSDIKHGGSTVFPRVNVEVKPVKGAAALWYNMKKSGVGDDRTEHAGCPVVLGQKWVANKWIHEYGQEWKRPCGLSPNSKDINISKKKKI